MDWITVTKEQVESDALPNVCMVCGEPTSDRVDKTFEHTPDWVGYLHIAGIIPGMIAESYCKTEMRVSCPICPDHRGHWSRLAWTGGIGWMLVFPFAAMGYALAGSFVPGVEARVIGSVSGAVVGVVVWLAILLRLGFTRIKVTKIDENGISFERVADEFVKAVKENTTKACA